MHRLHLLRWLALVVALCSFQCLEDLSDNCQKTRTCAPAPKLGSDCVWRYADGSVWSKGPTKQGNGLWVWPDGKRTLTQLLDCGDAGVAGLSGDAGIGLGPVDNCPDVPCGESLFCDPSHRCVKCLDDDACKGTSDVNRGETPVCDVRIHDCVACEGDEICGTGRHCKIDANPVNNRCVQCIRNENCNVGAGEVCDLGSNQCTTTCTAPGQCTRPKGVCAEGLCVGCIGNGDCSGATPQCNTARKECVPCVDSTLCANGQVCSPGNRCVPCVDDSTCRDEAKGHCDPVVNECVACLTSSQCTARDASKCNALHQCVPCTDSAQCEADAPVCNTTTGRCVACIDESTCTPGTPVCDRQSGNCVGCSANDDCTTDSTLARCDVPNHVCAACQSSTQCAGKFPPKNICSNGECVQCTGNGDCIADPNKSRCDATGLCASCRANGDCSAIPGKHACTGGNNGRCVECLANTDCTGNPRGLACNTATNTCVQCVADTDCKTAGASRCVANACVACVNDPASGNTPANSHCGHIVSGGKPLAVCDTSAGASAGVCVECTGDQRAACGANVCNSQSKSCSMFLPGSAATCLDCVSDAHCATTDRCVQETFNGTNLGFSCFPLKPAGNCPGRPYSMLASVTSIDKKPVDVCLPQLTTCAGVNQGKSGAPCTISADCGEVGLDDGACNTSVGDGVCSVPCSIATDCLSALSVCSSDSICR